MIFEGVLPGDLLEEVHEVKRRWSNGERRQKNPQRNGREEVEEERSTDISLILTLQSED